MGSHLASVAGTGQSFFLIWVRYVSVTVVLVGFIDWDDAAPGTRLHDLANAVYNYVDVSHWANQIADEQARRIHLRGSSSN